MSFFSKRSVFDDPLAYPLNETGILSWFQGWQTSSGRTLSEDSAMRIAAVYRCVQVLSDSVGNMPLRVYTIKDLKDVDRTPVLNLKTYTQQELWSIAVTHMCHTGDSFIFKVRNDAGLVVDLIPIEPNRVQVNIVNGDAVGVPFVKQFVVDNSNYLTDYEIMHTMRMSADGVRGRGALTYARNIAGIALSAEEAAGQLYENGLMIQGILSTEASLKKEQADALRERWSATNGGAKNAGQVAILGNGLKFQQVTINPADAEFLESRKFEVTEIARMFGLPGWVVNDQEKSTSWGAGISAQFTAMKTLTVQGYATALEQRVSKELLPTTQTCKFNFNEWQRGDNAERAAFYTAGVTGGWLTINEIRAQEGMPPVDWGDKPYLPNNGGPTPQQQVSQIDSSAKKSGKPGGDTGP